MANWMFGFFIDCVLEYGSEMISENEAFALANQQDWHRYAVLGHLGFSSLEDYVNRYTGPDDVEIDEMIQYQYEAWQDARACLGY